jgi:hypothetical protein
MDHNGVLDGTSLYTDGGGLRALQKSEIATGFENGQPSMFLAADTIKKLVFLRSQGVKLFTMSSNVLLDQVKLMQVIQRSVPAFKSDVLWNRTEDAKKDCATLENIEAYIEAYIDSGVRREYGDYVLEIPSSKCASMSGKDEIRRAYEEVGLIDATQRSSVVVMDDGRSVIPLAETEGYAIASFVDISASQGFDAFFKGLARDDGMTFQAAFNAHVAANPDLYKVIPFQPASSRISASAPSRTPVASAHGDSGFVSRAAGAAQGGAFVDDEPAGPATDASSPQALRQSLLSRQNDESGDSACCCVIQ